MSSAPPNLLNPNRGYLGMAAGYGVLHALVDAATVTAVFRAVSLHEFEADSGFAAILVYDLEAFASQVLFGLVIDRLRRPLAALVAGPLLAAMALLAVPVSPWAAVVLAGIGNSLFHVGAGVFTLRAAPRKALYPGIFVAPGALGLGFGIFYGSSVDLGPLWPLAALAVLALFAVLLLRRPPVEGPVEPVDRPDPPRWVPLLLALVFISVMVRSFVGFTSFRGCPKSDWFQLLLPTVAFLGKGLGGWISDRLGWKQVSVGALLVSAPLLAFGEGNAGLLLVGLLLFQMTMPVTLSAASLALPNHTATAFGLTCLALISGALPSFFPEGKALAGTYSLLFMIVISAASVFGALRLLGGQQGGRRDRA